MRKAFPVVLGFLFIAGCRTTAPLQKQAPSPTRPPQPTQIPARDFTDHLLGTWRNTEKRTKEELLVFSPGGDVTFKGGLEFYNPGRWSLDSGREELHITLPQADVDRLHAFQLSVGDSVKA